MSGARTRRTSVRSLVVALSALAWAFVPRAAAEAVPASDDVAPALVQEAIAEDAAADAADVADAAHVPDAPDARSAVDAPMRHAPRAYGFTLGYAMTPRNQLPLSATGGSFHPMGLAAELRYGWQVGGLDGSAPAWVGFSTSFFAHTRGSPRSSFGIDYGIFVRHGIFVRPQARGFFGYGLGATQVFVTDVEGRGIGHVTNLNLGVDVRLHGQLHATFEVAYRFVILPSFETALEPAHRYDFHALRLVAGLFFGG